MNSSTIRGFSAKNLFGKQTKFVDIQNKNDVQNGCTSMQVNRSRNFLMTWGEIFMKQF